MIGGKYIATAILAGSMIFGGGKYMSHKAETDYAQARSQLIESNSENSSYLKYDALSVVDDCVGEAIDDLTEKLIIISNTKVTLPFKVQSPINSIKLLDSASKYLDDYFIEDHQITSLNSKVSNASKNVSSTIGDDGKFISTFKGYDFSKSIQSLSGVKSDISMLKSEYSKKIPFNVTMKRNELAESYESSNKIGDFMGLIGSPILIIGLLMGLYGYIQEKRGM